MKSYKVLLFAAGCGFQQEVSRCLHGNSVVPSDVNATDIAMLQLLPLLPQGQVRFGQVPPVQRHYCI